MNDDSIFEPGYYTCEGCGERVRGVDQPNHMMTKHPEPKHEYVPDLMRLPHESEIPGVTFMAHSPSDNTVRHVYFNGVLVGNVFQHAADLYKPTFAATVYGPKDVLLGYHWTFDSAVRVISLIAEHYAPPF